MYNLYSKITRLSFNGVGSKLLKDQKKRLLRIISYNIYITHLMNYKHLLLSQIIKRIFDQINFISN